MYMCVEQKEFGDENLIIPTLTTRIEHKINALF